PARVSRKAHTDQRDDGVAARGPDTELSQCVAERRASRASVGSRITLDATERHASIVAPLELVARSIYRLPIAEALHDHALSSNPFRDEVVADDGGPSFGELES